MAIANTTLAITELDPDNIVENIKSTYKRDVVFQDYNFEGSALSLLANILMHDTYYRSFYLNMAYNETFLDSAIRRTSVVSRAKELDYVPRSVRSARAKILVTVSPNDNPAYISVEKGTKFRATNNGFSYIFQTDKTYSILNNNGTYQLELEIVEGNSTKQTLTVSNPNNLIIPIINKNIDTDTLLVKVRDSVNSSVSSEWTRANDILDVNGSSKVYFLFENMNGYYELHFGDGVLGAQPVIGNIIEISYVVSNGTAANDINRFSLVSNVGGYSNVNITTTDRARGGQDRETIESIKFNAPRTYDMQNRCVTTNDYKQQILNKFSDIEAISVWGGEKNDPPMYGKVYISIKPYDGYSITESRKQEIFNSIDKMNVHTIEPLFVDPTFIYVILDTLVYFDPTDSILSADDIRNKVATAISGYESNYLGTFLNKFRLSKLMSLIDSSDPAIVSNKTKFKLQKRFTPVVNDTFTYVLPFNTKLNHPYDGYTSILSSSVFYLPTSDKELYLDDDGYGNVRIYFLNNTTKVFINKTAGTINYSTGKIILKKFNPSYFNGTELKVSVEAEDNNFTPVKNQIVVIADSVITVIDDITGAILSKGSAITEGSTTTIEEFPVLKETVI